MTFKRTLIEAGFPVHQVGAETARERDSSSSLPPHFFLHVWWARRPMTPSMAAVLASLLPEDTNPDKFLRMLGIEKVVANVNGVDWTLPKDLLKSVEWEDEDKGSLKVTKKVMNRLYTENVLREKSRVRFSKVKDAEQRLLLSNVTDCVYDLFEVSLGTTLTVERKVADPATSDKALQILRDINFHPGKDIYGYSRAFANPVRSNFLEKRPVVLDATAGGGSIPLQAMRAGCDVIANELNPVASVILHATLEYPAKFGASLGDDIKKYGGIIQSRLDEVLRPVYPDTIDNETPNYIFCRQVTSPHGKNGEAPLLNSLWLSKEPSNQWAVRIIPSSDGKTVAIEPYQVTKGRGPNGEDPDAPGTVSKGIGRCPYTEQQIEGDEIKAQACGKSSLGRWSDRLYAVAYKRREPVLDDDNNHVLKRDGSQKTIEKVAFRAPNKDDLHALEAAKAKVEAEKPQWEAENMLPTEKVTTSDPRPVKYGMPRWCDMFTPRQLLCHMTLIEELNSLKPIIIAELGLERGKAVVTYLQFAIDKGLDYNSAQTRWEYTRNIVKGTFSRHDFSVKWTFGEMVFCGPRSGFAWCISQIIDAYTGLVELHSASKTGSAKIITGSATNMKDVDDKSVDAVCFDPPYYAKVQYAELSDYFYVWHRKTLKDLYPGILVGKQTDKDSEAVANPTRHGGTKSATAHYHSMMSGIFTECRRVLKDDGLMTLMFSDNSQEAWDALTTSLIENGWVITAATPVESEGGYSMNIKDKAAALSTIFITCRKRIVNHEVYWIALGGTGVRQEVRDAVVTALDDFTHLRLKPVDEMIACYGRALMALSKRWPVLGEDGNPISTREAMREASTVVATHQVAKLSHGRLLASDLDAETALCAILVSQHGLNIISYDEVSTNSRALGFTFKRMAWEDGYEMTQNEVGLATSSTTKRGQKATWGSFAPLLLTKSKVRVLAPDERAQERIDHPQTDWDVMQGLILAYRKGDMVVARAYLDTHAPRSLDKMTDLVRVWANALPDGKDRKEAEALHFGLRNVIALAA
jgi:putative DNA methylase